MNNKTRLHIELTEKEMEELKSISGEHGIKSATGVLRFVLANGKKLVKLLINKN